MPSAPAILKKVLKKVAPSPAKVKLVSELEKKLLQTARSAGANPLICGSVAKGTWLADKNELDLFLLFPETIERKEFEQKGLALAKKIASAFKAKFELEYAEHPYVHAFVKFGKETFDLDIVPCYDAPAEKIKSAVDRTPHHVKFILENISAEQKDQVRLLKKFLAAAGCYGADLRTSGFSGYLSELLILKYGNFQKVLEAVSSWTAGTSIDLKNPNPAHAELFKKFHAPLIVIDPVDANRNVGAAVSAESFFKFISAARAFLSKSTERFFFPVSQKPLSSAEIKKQIKLRGSNFCAIKFARPRTHGDIIWTQLRKVLKTFERALHTAGFKLLKADSYFDEKFCVLIFEFESWEISKTTKHAGPSIYAHKPSEGFLNHYAGKKVFIEGENWFVETEREFTDVESFLKNFLKQSEKELLLAGVPSKLASPMRKAKLICGERALSILNTKDFRIFLRRYF